MKSILLLTKRKWLLALALRENVEAMRLARESSGFGGVNYSCDYYVDLVSQAKSRERHYLALAKLGAAALGRMDGELKDILERSCLKRESGELIASNLGIKVRSFYRKKEEAIAAFDVQVHALMRMRQKRSDEEREIDRREKAAVRRYEPIGAKYYSREILGCDPQAGSKARRIDEARNLLRRRI